MIIIIMIPPAPAPPSRAAARSSSLADAYVNLSICVVIIGYVVDAYCCYCLWFVVCCVLLLCFIIVFY